MLQWGHVALLTRKAILYQRSLLRAVSVRRSCSLRLRTGADTEVLLFTLVMTGALVRGTSESEGTSESFLPSFRHTIGIPAVYYCRPRAVCKIVSVVCKQHCSTSQWPCHGNSSGPRRDRGTAGRGPGPRGAATIRHRDLE